MDIQNLLSQALGNAEIQKLAEKIGASPDQIQSGIQAAIPALMGGMERNARNPEGASAIATALDKDHDGSILDNLSGFIGGGNTTAGDGILKHVFGPNRATVESNIAGQTGLSTGQSGQLIAMLAPMLMGALGKAKQTGGLDAGGLAGMLSGFAGANASSISGMLGFLDKDKDGDVMDDLGGMIGGLFGKR